PRILAEPIFQLLLERQRLVVEQLADRVVVRRHQQLRLEIDQRGRHDEVRAGRLEVLELERLEVRKVLVGDRAHREMGEIDLVRTTEVQKEVERAFELADAEPEAVGRRRGHEGGVFNRHGASLTSDRTSAIVSCATTRARCDPSWMISTMWSGFSAKACRRSRMGPSDASMCSRSTSLQSRHPMPAVRQPMAQSSRSAYGVKILCKSNTGHTSGLPGSDRRLRAGSVTIGFTFLITAAALSDSRMSLP